MKRLLDCLLVMGMVGCGDPHPLTGLGATIEWDAADKIVSVDLRGIEVTDSHLLHRKGLTNLKELKLTSQVTDAATANE